MKEEDIRAIILFVLIAFVIMGQQAYQNTLSNARALDRKHSDAERVLNDKALMAHFGVQYVTLQAGH